MPLKEKLGLVEKIYVGVGRDRNRARPAPGTMLIELVDYHNHTLFMETVETSRPAPTGSWVPQAGNPSTFVRVGQTGWAHQAFQFQFDGDHPVKLPADLVAKAKKLGARRAYVWWSCEPKP